jgi:signal transduction histidine kinase
VTPDLLSLFTDSSVALLYFMCVVLFSYAALFIALGQRLRGPAEVGAARYTVAALAVSAAWMSLIIGAMAILVSGQPSEKILPPLDRAVSAMVVLLVGWAALTAERPRQTTNGINIITLLLVGVIAAAYAFTATQWYASPDVGFNASVFAMAWTLGTAALSAAMLLALIVQFGITPDAPLKMVFFALVLGGSAYTLWNMSTNLVAGDHAGVMRLVFWAAMPFFPVMVYRHVMARLSAALHERSIALQHASEGVRQPAPSSEVSGGERDANVLLKVLGNMLEHDKPQELPQQIVQAVSNSLKADVVAIVALDDAEYADVIIAYDAVQNRPIAAMALSRGEQPEMEAAIRAKAQRALNTDQNLNELVDLYTRLDIQKVGPAYFQPLIRAGEVIGVMVVALPYTQRHLRDNETRLLESMSTIAARLLALHRSTLRMKLEQEERTMRALMDGAGAEVPTQTMRSEMQASLEVARNQVNQLSNLVRDLQIELDYERGKLATLSADDPEGLSITQRLDRMSQERKQLESERERLMQALQEAQTQLATVSGDDDEVYGTVIRSLERERDELQSQKETLERELIDIRRSGQSPAVLRDLLSRLTEEKARLAVERDSIRTQLTDVESQLAALGIEGGTGGLANTIVALTEERSMYKALAERTVQERDVLLAERQKYGVIGDAAEKIRAMESELRRLAEDREALVRQRDQLRSERDTAFTDRDRAEEQRTNMVAEMSGLQIELEEVLADWNETLQERNGLLQLRNDLVAERDRLLGQVTALNMERDQLLGRLEGNRAIIEQVGVDGIGAMKKMIDDLTEERSELEHRVLNLDNKLKKTEAALNETKNKLAKSVPLPTSSSVDASTAEVMLSIAQELRTPLSSIGAYVDLLLGESVGILGALQRQFLQRVKANSDRLSVLIDDFVRVTALDTGQLNLKAQNVDLSEIIDDALHATRTQFREKGITLRLDVADELPIQNADRDALQQIVVQLLSNAYLASPTDGEVAISARVEHNYKGTNGTAHISGDVVMLTVRDNGGGVPMEEQRRVFTRLYRADNPLIQGLGDTGVGLSIARALVEAHGGKIWLETVPGSSSTFKVLLPVHVTEKQTA